MLKVAIPNKGSLSESAIAMLKEAGYRQRSDGRDLTLIDNVNEIEFYTYDHGILHFMLLPVN